MASGDKAGKGGGARKYGSNLRKCQEYRARNSSGNTPKARRVAKQIQHPRAVLTRNAKPHNGEPQPGWFLTSDRKKARPNNPSRKKVVGRSSG